MQTINLDISRKGVNPTIYAKQGDVGRKFKVIVTDNGVPFSLSSVAFSVWYYGASGEGNYTDIGKTGAFSVSGNTVTVELIAQMLSNAGCGTLCLVMNDVNGNQIGLWNIPYVVEFVPGADSEEAKDYYTAFSKAVSELPLLDFNSKTIIMLGDSNAAGYGWYEANGEVKCDKNDGVFAVLREKFPNTTFLNYAIKGAGFVDGENILEQIESIDKTPDIIFVWAGGNDISEYINGNMIITAPEMTSFAYEDFDESLYGNVNKALYKLRTKFPDAKICGVIRTYNQDQRVDIQQGIYGIISNIYRKYQCSVLNLNDYSNIVQKIDEQKDYWYDTKHYSKKAFEDLIAPIFYSALINNLNVNTYIPIQHMFTTLDHDDNKIAALENAFVQRINRSGSVILQNIPENQHDVFVGARIGYEETGALRIATRKHNVEHIFSYGAEQSVATVKMTTELSKGCDIANCISGKYVVPKTVRPSCTGLPDNLPEDVGFIIDIDVVDSTGFRYATIIDGRKNRWVGTYSEGRRSYSWDSITSDGGLLLKESVYDENGDETKVASVTIATRGVSDDDDTDVASGIVEFTETQSGGNCILRNIGDGIQDNDAATVGQLNEKNSIVFYNDNIDVPVGLLKTIKYNPALASQEPKVGDWLLSLNGCLCVVTGEPTIDDGDETQRISLRGRSVINSDGVLYTKQEVTPAQQAQARANIGITFFGVPYSSAEQVFDISAAGDSSVLLYMFATVDGYDAVVAGIGAIKDYEYTDATYTKVHTDNRPYNAEKINRLHIEEGITSIGNYFMYKAFNLQHLSFADSESVTHLGTRAFGYTSIGGEYDFSGLTDTVLDAAFIHCPKLQGVIFSGTITNILIKSFQMCIALRNVKGLSSVETIADAAFQYCTNLESIDVVPGNVTLWNWVFILTPVDAVVEGTETVLSSAGWKGQGSLCFTPNEWTAEQLVAIRVVTGESVQMPIPESDNQSTEFYKHWGLFPWVIDGVYQGVTHPASGCCGIFCLYHIFNILHPNSQYDTFYDWMMRGVVPNKIKVTQSLHNTLTSYEWGRILIAGNTDVSYDVGSEITARDLLMGFDEEGETWGEQGTSFWGVCQALGWIGTKMTIEDGAAVKQTILDNLTENKPVMMEIVGAAHPGHGAHAVVAIGYDADTDKLLIIDSTGGFDADVVPLSYWVSFEALITPDAASAIWTFDFGEVIKMTDIDNKLDILIESTNSGFHTESGTIVLEKDMLPVDGASNFKYNIPCSNGANMFTFYPDSGTLSAIKETTGTMYTTAILGNCFEDDIAITPGKPTGLFVTMGEVIYNGTSYGWTPTAGSIYGIDNTNGITFGQFALKAGTYHWTAYYWND